MARSPWSWRSRATVATAALFVAIQVGVPLVRLADPRPARLGWQMYSTVLELPAVTIERDGGDVEQVDMASLLARPRAEADYAAAIGRALCAGDRDIMTVSVTRNAQSIRVACP